MTEMLPRAHGSADRCYDRQFFFVFFFLLSFVFIASAHVFAGGREALAFFDAPAGRTILFAAAQERYDAAAAHGRAEEVAARLCAAAGETQGVQIIIRSGDQLNAYALPGRIIVLNAAALSLPEGELAALLAHELGHIVHGDPAAIILRSPRAMSALSGVRADADGSYDERAAKKILRAISYGALTQNEERRADVFAAALLPKAGFSCADARALLARMESSYGAVSRVNSHLSWEERRAIFCDDVDHAAARTTQAEETM
mgnify:FL=1